jgi:hypothetical protein
MACIYLADDKYVFQLFYAVASQMLYIAYLITYQPQNEKGENHLELFTELCIMLFIYTLMCFNNFVPDPNVRFNIGNASIAIFFGNILVNLGVVMVGQIKDLIESVK